MSENIIKTTIAGKSSNVIGSKDTSLVLRGQSIKIQWGNKFIDLIKNGKINVESQSLLYTITSEEQLTSDGIYLLNGTIWIVNGGTKVQLAGESTTTYVSYLTEQKDITAEQKNLALTNIGFYYRTLQDAKDAGISSGFIYVQEDNKLYLIINGELIEYTSEKIQSNPNNINTGPAIIQDNKLIIDGHEWITFNNAINIYDKVVLNNTLQSNNANSNYGYRLYIQDGKSVLEIDKIIEREKSELEIYEYQPIYSKHNNIITSYSIDGSQVTCRLKFPGEFAIGDTVLVYNNEELKEYSVIKADVNSVTLNISSDIQFKGHYIYNISHPYIYFKNNNLVVQEGSNIPIKIGELKETDLRELNSCYTINSKMGLFANNFIGLNSKLYDTIFKVRCHYPKYEEGITIPEGINDQTIVTASWVQKELANNLLEIDEKISNINDTLYKLSTKTSGISTELELLKNTVNTTNSTVTNLESNVEDINEQLKNDYVKKDELSEFISNEITSSKGGIDNPVIILSGTIQYSDSKFVFNGSKKVSITEVKASAKDGLLTVDLVSGSDIYITSAHVTQADSKDAPSMAAGITKLEKNGSGAHWYGVNFNSNMVYIREFHQGNENNDSWVSSTWESAYIINITLFGYIIDK